MKNLLTAILFTTVLTAISFGQTRVSSGAQLEVQDSAKKPRIAVLEFTSEPNNTNAAQTAQKGVYLWVRDITKVGSILVQQNESAAVHDLYRTLLGREVDPATAVKIGKLLGVNYVVTGHVKVFNGITSVDLRVVETLSKRDLYFGQVRLTSAGDWTADGTISGADVNRTAIQRLTASLKAADL